MKFHIFLEHIYQLTRIPIRIYTRDGRKIQHYSTLEGKETDFEETQINIALQRLEQKDFVFAEDGDFFTALAGCRGREELIILGPAVIGKTDSSHYRAMKKKYHIQDFPNVQLRELLLTSVLILNECSDKEYTLEMVLAELQGETLRPLEHILHAELRQYDSFQKNHTYVEEQAFFEHIRNGDAEYIKNKYEVMTPPHPMVVNNLQKNEEYMAVIEISMAARSAIEGGLTSREALLMNDIYLKQLAECESVNQIFKLKKEACLEFAHCVKKQKETEVGNSYVEDCKKDIHSRKREKIDLQKIADDIGISKEYMLKLFKRYEGISITDYILNVKLEAACNMLKFSDRKIGEISDYLAFGSLNYFSRIFTKRIGMPPKEYRRLHHQPNF